MKIRENEVVEYMCNKDEDLNFDDNDLKIIDKSKDYYFKKCLSLYDEKDFEKLNKILSETIVEKYEAVKASEDFSWIFETAYNESFIEYAEKIIYKK